MTDPTIIADYNPTCKNCLHLRSSHHPEKIGGKCSECECNDFNVREEEAERYKSFIDTEVNHPQHYNDHPAGIEAIDVIQHFNFNVGNAIKYLWRAGLKPNEPAEKDIKKAMWYCKQELKRRREFEGSSDSSDGTA